jgi:hypothetical protein
LDWLKRAHRSKNLAPFIPWIPLIVSLFLSKIEAKTASTTVSNDNQLAMGLLETTEWLIVGWGLCRGIKTASTTTIVGQKLVCTFLLYVYLLLEKPSVELLHWPVTCSRLFCMLLAT